MLRRVVPIFAVCFFVRVIAVGAGERLNDAKDLQGEWQAVDLEAQGKKASAEEVKGFRVLIKDDEITFNPRGEGRKSKFKSDPSKTPKAMDLIPQDGPGKGKGVAGIYSLENGQLRLCVRNFGGDPTERPKEFKTQVGDGLSVMTLERVGKGSLDVDGVELRIRSDKTSWSTNEIPTLHAELRNGGSRSHLAVCWGMSELQLEVDGKWYKAPFCLGGPCNPFEPGAVMETPVTVSPVWFEAKEDKLGWMGTDLKVFFDPEHARFIELRPGSHVVRVGCVILPARADASPGFRVVSNAVKVVIKAPTTSRPVNWPASPELAKTVVVDIAYASLKILKTTEHAAVAATVDAMLASARNIEKESAGTPLQAASQAFIEALTVLRRTMRDQGKPARDLEETKTASKNAVAMVRVLAGLDAGRQDGQPAAPAAQSGYKLSDKVIKEAKDSAAKWPH
jgi:uncharacterized protein (TIGR03067 family)